MQLRSIVSALLLSAFAVSLFACGGSGSSASPAASGSAAATAAPAGEGRHHHRGDKGSDSTAE